MRTLPPLFGLVALVVFTAPAAANAGEGHDAQAVVQHIFDVADQDEDGALTRSEYEQAGLQNFGVSFEESDLDADGSISVTEYFEIYREHHPPADASET